MTNEQISAPDFLNLLKNDETLISLDVRSEAEFAKASIPQGLNVPILNNTHRKTVGITYKMMGQEAAISIGHELVSPIKETMISSWQASLQHLHPDHRFLYCWRGGLRSQMAAQWLSESGFRVRRVEGGYKALRRELHHSLSDSYELILLTGLTGSGKTRLLQRFSKSEQLDLEAFARHRGSAFGPVVGEGQPSQQSFENLLGLRVYHPSPLYIVEHEGRCVGKILIPQQFLERMNQAPLVFLEKSMEERVHHIYGEYVERPLADGKVTVQALREILLGQLLRIKRRLGGVHFGEIEKAMLTAFTTPPTLSAHSGWIRDLLLHYYDRQYNYAIAHAPSPIIFRGDEEACTQFLQERLRCAHKAK
ncbi:MAG: tRNA 2-selenouridine(34) synthase MnmH [Bdellovibrionales bacterium GWA2_49_15]|nr:MAG: tRNA 2-selenouridine(34) synthase MnmH [Bdellovibrionales bacterium GWA2_49_15]HAZ11311.1 tRNA 2-selenouridine(34) synthase MnmH [Bdellovibrionales bacterium]